MHTQQGGLQAMEGAVHFRKEFQSYEAFTSDGAFGNTFLMSPSACRDPLKLSFHIWKMEATTIINAAAHIGL